MFNSFWFSKNNNDSAKELEEDPESTLKPILVPKRTLSLQDGLNALQIFGENPNDLMMGLKGIHTKTETDHLTNPQALSKNKLRIPKSKSDSFRDLKNFLKTDDVFLTNYKFEIRMNTTANTAYITGTFNNWSLTETSMELQNDRWVAYVQLDISKNWQYKYIIDGVFTIDELSEKVPDGSGNFNNILKAKKASDNDNHSVVRSRKASLDASTALQSNPLVLVNDELYQEKNVEYHGSPSMNAFSSRMSSTSVLNRNRYNSNTSQYSFTTAESEDNQVKILNSTVKNLEDEIVKLRNELENSKSKNTKDKKNQKVCIELSNRHINHLESELATCRVSANSENKILGRKLEIEVAEKSELKTSSNILKNIIEEQKELVSNLKEENSVLNKRLELNSINLISLQEELSDYISKTVEMESLNKKVFLLNMDLEAAWKDSALFQNELDQINAKHSSVMEDLQIENSNFKKKLDLSLNDNNVLKVQIEKLTEEKNSNQVIVDNLNAEKIKVMEKFNVSLREKEQLESEKQLINEDLILILENKNTLLMEVDNKIKQIKVKEEECKDMEIKLQKNLESIKAEQEKNEQLQLENFQLKEKIGFLENDNGLISKNLSTKIEEMKENNALLYEEFEKKEKLHLEKHQENEVQYGELKNRLVLAEKCHLSFKEQCTLLNVQLLEKEEAYKNLVKTTKTMEDDNEKLTVAHLKTYEKLKKKSQKDLQKVTSELETIDMKLRKVNQDYQESTLQATMQAKRKKKRHLSFFIYQLLLELNDTCINLNVTKTENEELNKNIKEYKNQLHELHQKYSHIKKLLEENLCKGKIEVDENLAKNQSLQLQLHNCLSEMEVQKTELSESLLTSDELKKEVESQNNEIANLKLFVKQCKSEKNSLENKLMVTSGNLNDAKTQIEQITKGKLEVTKLLNESIKKSDTFLQKANEEEQNLQKLKDNFQIDLNLKDAALLSKDKELEKLNNLNELIITELNEVKKNNVEREVLENKILDYKDIVKIKDFEILELKKKNGINEKKLSETLEKELIQKDILPSNMLNQNGGKNSSVLDNTKLLCMKDELNMKEAKITIEKIKNVELSTQFKNLNENFSKMKLQYEGKLNKCETQISKFETILAEKLLEVEQLKKNLYWHVKNNCNLSNTHLSPQEEVINYDSTEKITQDIKCEKMKKFGASNEKRENNAFTLRKSHKNGCDSEQKVCEATDNYQSAKIGGNRRDMNEISMGIEIVKENQALAKKMILKFSKNLKFLIKQPSANGDVSSVGVNGMKDDSDSEIEDNADCIYETSEKIAKDELIDEIDLEIENIRKQNSASSLEIKKIFSDAKFYLDLNDEKISSGKSSENNKFFRDIPEGGCNALEYLDCPVPENVVAGSELPNNNFPKLGHGINAFVDDFNGNRKFEKWQSRKQFSNKKFIDKKKNNCGNVVNELEHKFRYDSHITNVKSQSKPYVEKPDLIKSQLDKNLENLVNEFLQIVNVNKNFSSGYNKSLFSSNRLLTKKNLNNDNGMKILPAIFKIIQVFVFRLNTDTMFLIENFKESYLLIQNENSQLSKFKKKCDELEVELEDFKIKNLNLNHQLKLRDNFVESIVKENFFL
ncbi:hypothetical protein HK099_008034 [Clydaea vesicula]|uniref:AMP-activated protein kinase glycogen-binding domain-containing protein n=1 Tax=Clydaea vesicula TaxID=447962 RepID=A0AAD5XXW8_9FUNG|nr:hypothetical protein HK099_008034 [Clydaea vesicula]